MCTILFSIRFNDNFGNFGIDRIRNSRWRFHCVMYVFNRQCNPLMIEQTILNKSCFFSLLGVERKGSPIR